MVTVGHCAATPTVIAFTMSKRKVDLILWRVRLLVPRNQRDVMNVYNNVVNI